MEDYKRLCRELIVDEIDERTNYDKDATKWSVLGELSEDTQNVFGNIDGSRTMSTHKAQDFIDQSGAIWDTDIHELFESISDDYFCETLKRGAETLDVVILELLSHQVISEMLEEEE